MSESDLESAPAPVSPILPAVAALAVAVVGVRLFRRYPAARLTPLALLGVVGLLLEAAVRRRVPSPERMVALAVLILLAAVGVLREERALGELLAELKARQFARLGHVELGLLGAPDDEITADAAAAREGEAAARRRLLQRLQDRRPGWVRALVVLDDITRAPGEPESSAERLDRISLALPVTATLPDLAGRDPPRDRHTLEMLVETEKMTVFAAETRSIRVVERCREAGLGDD